MFVGCALSVTNLASKVWTEPLNDLLRETHGMTAKAGKQTDQRFRAPNI